MGKYQDMSLTDYTRTLSERSPTPGGGSAAALTAALGTALLSMVGNYSLGRGLPAGDERAIRGLLKKTEANRARLLTLVDLDAAAYDQVVATRQGPARARQSALRQAQRVPSEVARLCYRSIELTPLLIEKGNPYLLSDVQVAAELLLSAFRSAMVNVRVNQK